MDDPWAVDLMNIGYLGKRYVLAQALDPAEKLWTHRCTRNQDDVWLSASSPRWHKEQRSGPTLDTKRAAQRRGCCLRAGGSAFCGSRMVGKSGRLTICLPYSWLLIGILEGLVRQESIREPWPDPSTFISNNFDDRVFRSSWAWLQRVSKRSFNLRSWGASSSIISWFRERGSQRGNYVSSAESGSRGEFGLGPCFLSDVWNSTFLHSVVTRPAPTKSNNVFKSSSPLGILIFPAPSPFLAQQRAPLIW